MTVPGRRRRSGRPSITRWILAAPLALVIVAGCIPPRPSPSSPPVPSPTEPESVAPSASVPPSPGESAASSGVTVDPTLLDVLPADIDGVPLKPDTETADAIARDGSIAPFVSSVALAAAFGPVASDTPGDYVVVTVARLRPGTFGDAFFRGWRDTFDDAVCQQAGGVGGHAEADIGTHHAYIGTCNGGVHTYHVHLPADDIIVSMQSVGEGRYGERVVAGLTE
jgi:hypothetical protein